MDVFFFFFELLDQLKDILKKYISIGSFSKIYSAIKISTNIIVALKICKKKYLENEFILQMRIKSRFVVSVYELFKTNNFYFASVEYCGGGILSNVIDKHEKIPKEVCAFYINNQLCLLKKVLQYASDILNGLKDIHENDIIHRDLKPDNIFIREDGSCCIGISNFIYLFINLKNSGDFSMSTMNNLFGRTIWKLIIMKFHYGVVH
jgi:serine/threonine protein kinase